MLRRNAQIIPGKSERVVRLHAANEPALRVAKEHAPAVQLVADAHARQELERCRGQFVDGSREQTHANDADELALQVSDRLLYCYDDASLFGGQQGVEFRIGQVAPDRFAADALGRRRLERWMCGRVRRLTCTAEPGRSQLPAPGSLAYVSNEAASLERYAKGVDLAVLRGRPSKDRDLPAVGRIQKSIAVRVETKSGGVRKRDVRQISMIEYLREKVRLHRVRIDRRQDAVLHCALEIFAHASRSLELLDHAALNASRLRILQRLCALSDRRRDTSGERIERDSDQKRDSQNRQHEELDERQAKGPAHRHLVFWGLGPKTTNLGGAPNDKPGAAFRLAAATGS